MGALGIPVLDTSAVTNRKQLSDTISAHREQLDQRRVDEERRLLYVGVTRAEDTVLVSGHHWGATGLKPRGPSDFLCELKDIIERSAAAGDPCGTVDQWDRAPVAGERNPLLDDVVEAVWPTDPLATRRGDVERGARLVAEAISADAGVEAPLAVPRSPISRAGQPTSMRCWPSGRVPWGRRRERCRTSCR
ncbi:uvrD-like helicase C-terminal domain protein [Mycobacterium ulcerans str. Harvey]|uniref:UvrD-like helicase C-terminal domain protein n=1 Tax=Mycobacterium ulcerans str. Harvey TaxID=1299332 RepID=A0ABN0QXP5_MYCUL|nr:uvrD-like helicase C-terminal domain protein [Mycobacterium ulcerans str. Harvey]